MGAQFCVTAVATTFYLTAIRSTGVGTALGFGRVGSLAGPEDPGYWVKSRILVMRTWRGAPSTVAEVWTPVATNCDSPPIAGFYFVALVPSEKGRSVARNSLCDHALKAAATKERGSFAVAAITIAAAGVGAAAVALLWFVRLMRQRRASR